jgi:hypothetical protein
MIKFKYAHLYSEPSSSTLNIEEVAGYVRDMIHCDIDVRNEFFTHFLTQDKINYVVDKIVRSKVLDPRKSFAMHESTPIEIQFEKKVLANPGTRYLGILYDGFELQSIFNHLIPSEENNLEHIHIAFTNRLVCTYSEDDSRYHYRAIICGYPTLICTSGIVEAPAKPKDFYFLQQYYASVGNMNLDEIKKKFEGRFIDYDDARLTEVVKGYVMQGLFYYIIGDPFCAKKECRLLNAHWQEDLIESQINNGNLCQDHLKMLNEFKTLI